MCTLTECPLSVTKMKVENKGRMEKYQAKRKGTTIEKKGGKNRGKESETHLE